MYLLKKTLMKIVPTSKSVDIAFITGEMPNRTIEKICSGSVVEPGPATKNVMTKSSIDNVKAIKNAATIPGIAAGIITFFKAINFVAPRS